jgi:predicted TIM-barrel fold metal-dependent hydrolase
LDDLLAALDREYDDIAARGFVAVKCAVAYERVLRFEDEPRPTAERVFEMLLSRDLADRERRPFEDYMMRQIVERAEKRGLPIQIHTGLHAGGNIISNSNPAHLASLFLRHRKARFVLFHGGFPYMGELAAVAKNFPNAHIDLCWMPAVSPASTKLWLHQWLDTVPVNKIFAFGGDTQTPEGSYGHCVLTRRILAEVLTEEVLAGRMSESDASFIARRLLRENAIELYKLQRFL